MNRLNLSETKDRLKLLIRAGFPVIYIVSNEESRVLSYLIEIYDEIHQENPRKELCRWYEEKGIQKYKLNQNNQRCWETYTRPEKCPSPKAAL